jgi:hypothetical protein
MPGDDLCNILQNKREVREATQYLYDNVIPTFAKQLENLFDKGEKKSGVGSLPSPLWLRSNLSSGQMATGPARMDYILQEVMLLHKMESAADQQKSLKDRLRITELIHREGINVRNSDFTSHGTRFGSLEDSGALSTLHY